MIRDMYPGIGDGRFSCVMCSRCKTTHVVDPLIKSPDQISFILLNLIFASKYHWIKVFWRSGWKQYLSGALTMKKSSILYEFVWQRKSAYPNYRLSQASSHNNEMLYYNINYFLVNSQRSALAIFQFWNQYSLSQKTGLLLDAMCQRTIVSTSQVTAKSIIV